MRYFLYCRKSQEEDERQALSLATQTKEAQRHFGARDDVAVVETLEEARTAKVPGRSVFNEMLDRIEHGEADGIVAYAPDRLARNSVDSGRIVHMLDTGALKDLKFVTFHFENTPNGKFMLLIMFAQSKQYSDVLSERVRTGMRDKIELLGVRSNRAPEGYLNVLDEKRAKIIAPDPDRFSLLRGIVDMILAGTHSPAEATRIANDEWGYRTRKTAKQGGKHLALCTTYKMLGNPFYAGLIRWNGELYQGVHTPLMSVAEFEALQKRLGRTTPARPKRHDFPFTGLMRCGACGLMITAEAKTKPSGRSYVYYHCTKRGLGPRCSERSVEKCDLEGQIVAFLETLAIHPAFEQWALAELQTDRKRRTQLAEDRTRSAKRALAETATQLNELRSLRLRRLITDDEFARDRERLELERHKLSEQLAQTVHEEDRFEPVISVISMRKKAVDWFTRGNDRDRKLIFKLLGSNPTVKAGKLIVDAAKPFARAPDIQKFLSMCTDIEDVRTDGSGAAIACPAGARSHIWAFIKDIADALDGPAGERTIRAVRALEERFEAGDRQQAALSPVAEGAKLDGKIRPAERRLDGPLPA